MATGKQRQTQEVPQDILFKEQAADNSQTNSIQQCKERDRTMIKLPLEKPKSCRDCPFLMPETFYGGRKRKFFCYLIYALQGYGGYEDKEHETIAYAEDKIKDIKKLHKDCLIKRYNTKKGNGKK